MWFVNASILNLLERKVHGGAKAAEVQRPRSLDKRILNSQLSILNSLRGATLQAERDW